MFDYIRNIIGRDKKVDKNCKKTLIVLLVYCVSTPTETKGVGY